MTETRESVLLKVSITLQASSQCTCYYTCTTLTLARFIRLTKRNGILSMSEAAAKAIRHALLPCCVLFSSVMAISSSTAVVASEYNVDPDTGFRMERYRTPVPQSIPDGQTVDTAFVADAVVAGTMQLIDVYPPKGLGPDPLNGRWLTDETRLSLPGALWLPDVGRGHLENDAIDYFKRNLVAISNGDKAAPLLFFCTADCWQGWNAAVRAIRWGYSNVFWYPLGTDGWAEIDGEVERVDAVNFLQTVDHTEQTEGSLETLPASAAILLQDRHGEKTTIGSVSFGQPVAGGRGFTVNIESHDFSDHFLSMRPFQCLTHPKEWFCHQPYPYHLDNVIMPGDFTDLEYHLLFIRKTPAQFGIDAWNGVYYKLKRTENGFRGELLEGDLNVLQEPPEPGSKPIGLAEFHNEDSHKRAYPTLLIRP